jgi:hypothetical protein
MPRHIKYRNGLKALLKFKRCYSGALINLLVRALLALAFQIAGGMADWNILRLLVSEAHLYISNAMRFNMHRVSFDMLELNGDFFHYTPACTFIDVFLLSIPLIWNLHAGLNKNILKLCFYFIALSLFNLVRLQISILLFDNGMPWWLAHDKLTSICYFLIFLWIVKQGQLNIPLKTRSNEADIPFNKYEPVDCK